MFRLHPRKEKAPEGSLRYTLIRTIPSVGACIHDALNQSRFAYILLYSQTLAARSVDVARWAGSITESTGAYAGDVPVASSQANRQDS